LAQFGVALEMSVGGNLFGCQKRKNHFLCRGESAPESAGGDCLDNSASMATDFRSSRFIYGAAWIIR